MNLLSIVAGLLQMTIVMLAAGLLARWLQKRSPELAATIGLSGLLLSLGLLSLTLLNAPRLFETRLAAEVETPKSASQVIAGLDNAPADVATEPPTTADDANRSLNVSVGDFLGWLGKQTVSTRPRQLRSAQWMVMLAVLIAILPIIMGLLATAQLHYRSALLTDAETEMLRRSIKQSTQLDFRCSQMVDAPCVTLFGGRAIYLPNDWQEWPRDELAAAIAHEAAHIRRRDPCKRLIGQTAASIQLFHPFAIWLSRSIMLSQEMAADRDAAATHGVDYANQLSRIALRMDASIDGMNSCRGASSVRSMFRELLMGPGIVSVSSTHLIRRIEMLQTHPLGCGTRKFAMASQVALIGVFAICASWTVRADPPANALPNADSPSARVASLPPSDSDEQAIVFAQPKFSPWRKLRPNHTGFAAIRVEKLLAHPMFSAAAPALVEPILDQFWPLISTAEAQNQRESLGLKLVNVESIVASFNFDVSKTEPKGEDDNNSTCTAGSDGAVLRFKQPVSHDPINAAIDRKKIVGLFEEHGVDLNDLGGRTMAEFADVILSGIFIDGAKTKELRLMPKKAKHDKRPFKRLKQAWNATDGGAMTACFTLPESLGFIEDENDRQVEKLLSGAAVMSVGLDFTTNLEPAYARVALVPRENTSVNALKSIAQETIDTFHDYIIALIANRDDSESFDAQQIDEVKKVRDILATHQLATASSRGDGDHDCVLITFRVPMESLALIFIL